MSLTVSPESMEERPVFTGRPSRTLRRARVADLFATGVMWTAALLLVVVLFGVILTLMISGLPALSWNFLFTAGSFDTPGIGPQIWVSLYTLFLTLLVVVPLGTGAAVYLSEYAPPNRVTSLIRFSTEALASVPSIVYGVFGSIAFLTTLHLGYSIASGALTLALLNLPLMVRVAEDAIRSVPQSYREGSLALAASQWETIRKVVLPTAMPGLLTAMVLTAGRILGETAPLILTMGTTISPNAYYSLNPFSTGETLAVHIWVIKIVGVPGMPNAQAAANGSAAVMLLIVLLINLGVAYLNSRLAKRLSGATIPRAGSGNNAEARRLVEKK
jgi:phosphate transport system permease protein